jgi:predicted ATPase/DNA-binding SARP family transcriptional activator
LAVRLALAGGSGVGDETLARDLWGDRSVDRSIAESLRVLVHRLRRTLGEHASAVRRTASGYAMDAWVTDLTALESALSRPGPRRAILELWRGPAFADLRSIPFAAAEGARLDMVQVELWADRIEADLDGDPSLGVELERLVNENPLHERLTGMFAVWLYRSGRQAAALEQLARVRRQLDEELGVRPTAAVAELELRILRQDPDLLPPMAVIAGPTRSNQFLGREAERRMLLQDLPEPGLITLTGGPGMGKTRLAREVADEIQATGRFVVWLNLATLTRNDSLPAALAAAIGLSPGPGDPIPDCLAKLHSALLVLDNAEHVVEEVADLVAVLLRGADRLSLLITSQRPLHVTPEEVRQVGPLSAELAGELFCLRSGAPLDHNVEAICAAVDRSPLGIELAAGLTRALTVEQLALRIPQRLRLLVAGNRGGHGRHSSLREAVAWSYSLLDPPARTALQALSVFAGGSTLEAAEQLLGAEPDIEVEDVPALLHQLVDWSLVTVDTHSGGPRFQQLETIRAYAAEQLTASGRENEVRARHAQWCVELTAPTEKYGGPDHADLVRLIRTEEANIRAGITWALGEGGEPALVVASIATPTWWYWWTSGHMAEATGWIRTSLAVTDPTPSSERATALRAMASLTRNGGDLREARVLGEEALEMFTSLGDARGRASSLLGLCITLTTLTEYDEALRLGNQAVEEAAAIGNPRVHNAAYSATGIVLRCMGRDAEAEERFLRVRDLWMAIDDRRGLAGTIACLATLTHRTGRLTECRAYCLDALRRYRDLEITDGLADIVEIIAAIEVDEGRPAEGLRLLSVAARTRLEIGTPLTIPDEIADRDDAEHRANLALGATAGPIVVAAATIPLTTVVAELLKG